MVSRQPGQVWLGASSEMPHGPAGHLLGWVRLGELPEWNLQVLLEKGEQGAPVHPSGGFSPSSLLTALLLKGTQSLGWLWEMGDPEGWGSLTLSCSSSLSRWDPTIDIWLYFDVKGQGTSEQAGDERAEAMCFPLCSPAPGD